MDSDRETKTKQKTEESEVGDYKFDALSILQPMRIRCDIQDGSRFNRFLLGYSKSFLPYCWILSWILFLLLKH